MATEKITLEVIIPPEKAGLRLDLALAQLVPDYSRTTWTHWITDGKVTLNQNTPIPRHKVKAGDKIIVNTELEDKNERWEAQAIDIETLYQDDDIIVINKPAGLTTHPGAGTADNTLLNALLYHYPNLSHLSRAGIVHRLDKNTSGLLVIAHSLLAHHSLTKQIQLRTVKRLYTAIVNGSMTAGGKIALPIGRHPLKRTLRAVTENGKPATTHYRIIERFRAHTLVSAQLETGRTHQIRVHMAHINHPLVGDPEYGKRLAIPKYASAQLSEALRDFKRQALHATSLAFTHPITEKAMQFECPLPEDMQTLITLLRKDMDENHQP